MFHVFALVKGINIYLRPSLLNKDLNNVDVRIVGDGEMREELENQIRELQLNNVYFLGR